MLLVKVFLEGWMMRERMSGGSKLRLAFEVTPTFVPIYL